MKPIFSENAWREYTELQNQDIKTVKRINELIKSIQRDGFGEGIGKPEPFFCILLLVNHINYGDFMKTFAKYLLFCGAALAFLACGNHYDYELNKLQTGISPVSSSSSIAFNVQYTRPYGSEPATTVISSKNEIEQYYGNQEVKIWDKQSDVLYDRWSEQGYNTIEKYSDDYFADNFLVIVERWEPSGSFMHKVERIDKNGDIIINRLMPSPHTTDIGHWGIIIELNNSFKVEQFQAVFVDVYLN